MTIKYGILCLFVFSTALATSQTNNSLMLTIIMKDTAIVETPLSIIKSVWNETNNAWDYEWRGMYDYYENGFRKTEVVSKWQDNNWSENNQVFFDYSNGNLIEQLFYQWEDYDEIWIPKSRTLYSYSNFNKITQKLDFNWLQSQNKWVNDTLMTYEYDSVLNLIETNMQVWSGFFDTWENNSQTLYSYISGNNVEQIFSIWDFDYLIWDIQRLTHFDYDTANQVIEKTIQLKSSFDRNLLNNSKIEYSYFADGKIKEEVYWDWIEIQNDWFENDKVSYKYDDNSKLTMKAVFYYDWDYLIWMNRYQTIYEYNSSSQLIKATYYYWNYGRWNQLYCYNYYYSGYNAVSYIEPLLTMQIFPNPANEVLQIQLSKPWYGEVKVQISDLSGREVYANLYHTHESSIEIRLHDFTSGIYLVNLLLGNNVFAKKIFIQK